MGVGSHGCCEARRLQSARRAGVNKLALEEVAMCMPAELKSESASGLSL